MSKFLLVGLGNIGNEYAGTRHNIGFDIADAFVQKHGGFFRSGRLADVSEVKWKGKIIVAIKPTTYMNLSGRAVKYWMDSEKIALENILVLLDDLALPLSKVRLKGSGSDAGHNGLTSIQESLQTQKYARLRFGIGSNFAKGFQSDFVLGRWERDEQPLVKLKIDKCVEIIESFIAIGIERTMSQWNNLEFAL